MELKIFETIVAYFAIVALIYSYTKLKYVNTSNIFFPTINYSVFDIVSFSFLLTVFNVVCSNLSERIYSWQGDRGNYFYSFTSQRDVSLGINFLFDVVRFLNIDFLFFLYATTFVCSALSFYGLKKFKFFTINALLFIFFTDYFFQTFGQLKQCYTNAFSLMFFSVFFNSNSKLRDVICLVLALCASFFHTTGFILFPIFVALKIVEEKPKFFLHIIIALFFCLLIFKPLLSFLANITASIIPSLSSKIFQYFFDETADMNDGSYMTFIKGFPFYFITFLGFVRKKYLQMLIPNYENFLLISIIGSILYFFSIFSYWMFRFTSLFYVPIAVFFCLIVRYEKNLLDKYFEIITVFGILLIVRIRHIIISYINSGGLA